MGQLLPSHRVAGSRRAAGGRVRTKLAGALRIRPTANRTHGRADFLLDRISRMTHDEIQTFILLEACPAWAIVGRELKQVLRKPKNDY